MHLLDDLGLTQVDLRQCRVMDSALHDHGPLLRVNGSCSSRGRNRRRCFTVSPPRGGASEGLPSAVERGLRSGRTPGSGNAARGNGCRAPASATSAGVGGYQFGGLGVRACDEPSGLDLLTGTTTRLTA